MTTNFAFGLQFLWDTLLCIERKHLPWEKPSALTSFNSSHFLSPHLNNQNFPRGPFFRQNLLLSDLTLDYQLSTPIITIQHWWEIILDVCFFMNEGFYFWIVIVIVWYHMILNKHNKYLSVYLPSSWT